MRKTIKKGKKRDVLEFKCSKCGAKWQSDEWSDIWWGRWFKADYCYNCKKFVETSSGNN
jgi:ribosomal protein L44E